METEATLTSAGNQYPAPHDRQQRLLADIRELAPDITSRAAEIEAGAPDPARSGRHAEIDRRLSHVRASEPWRARARSADGAGDHRSARQNRRFGRLDRGDRQRGRHLRALAAAGDLRAGLRARPGRHHCRLGPACGDGRGGGGGWRVNGRWPFASGCQHADWMFGLCVMTEGGKPVPGEAGRRSSGASFCRRATGRSRTPGTSQGSRGPGAITSPSRTRWSRRRISSTSRAACRACPDRSIKPCRNSFR